MSSEVRVREIPLAELDHDLGVQLSRYALWGIGGLVATASFVAGPWLGLTVVADPSLANDTAAWLGGVVAISTVLAGLGVAFGHFAVAWGLGEGKRWAWLTTLLMGALSLATCCLPLSVLFLWGMLNDRTRGFFAPPPPRLPDPPPVESGYQLQ